MTAAITHGRHGPDRYLSRPTVPFRHLWRRLQGEAPIPQQGKHRRARNEWAARTVQFYTDSVATQPIPAVTPDPAADDEPDEPSGWISTAFIGVLTIVGFAAIQLWSGGPIWTP